MIEAEIETILDFEDSREFGKHLKIYQQIARDRKRANKFKSQYNQEAVERNGTLMNRRGLHPINKLRR